MSARDQARAAAVEPKWEKRNPVRRLQPAKMSLSFVKHCSPCLSPFVSLTRESAERPPRKDGLGLGSDAVAANAAWRSVDAQPAQLMN